MTASHPTNPHTTPLFYTFVAQYALSFGESCFCPACVGFPLDVLLYRLAPAHSFCEPLALTGMTKNEASFLALCCVYACDSGTVTNEARNAALDHLGFTRPLNDAEVEGLTRLALRGTDLNAVQERMRTDLRAFRDNPSRATRVNTIVHREYAVHFLAAMPADTNPTGLGGDEYASLRAALTFGPPARNDRAARAAPAGPGRTHHA